MKRRKIRAAALLAALVLAIAQTGAQSSAHQRLGVENPGRFSFAVGFSLESSMGGADEEGSWILQPSIELEMRDSRGWKASIILPAAVRIPAFSGAGPPAMALGDILAALDASLRVEDWIIGVELAYSHPTGIWNAWEAEGRGIVSGSGRASLGFSARASLLSDPVAAGFSLGMQSGIGGYHRSPPSPDPLSIGASANLTYAINGTFSVSTSISEKLIWPRGLWADTGRSPPRLSAAGAVFAAVSNADWSLSAGISKILSETDSPPSLLVTWSKRLHAGSCP